MSEFVEMKQMDADKGGTTIKCELDTSARNVLWCYYKYMQFLSSVTIWWAGNRNTVATVGSEMHLRLLSGQSKDENSVSLSDLPSHLSQRFLIDSSTYIQSLDTAFLLPSHSLSRKTGADASFRLGDETD
jgi:hypothetical protein